MRYMNDPLGQENDKTNMEAHVKYQTLETSSILASNRAKSPSVGSKDLLVGKGDDRKKKSLHSFFQSLIFVWSKLKLPFDIAFHGI